MVPWLRSSRRAFLGTNEQSASERKNREGGGRGDAGEGGATRATAAATAASRCKESYMRWGEGGREGKGKSRGQACYKRKKDPGGKGRWGRKGDLPIYEERGRERERDRGLAQKRANVDKIGGGSLQLLAGMSGNAWDSILKARPRQSPPRPSSPPSSPASYSSASLLSTFINGYSVRPLPCTGWPREIRRGYLIAWLDRRDHIAHLIRTTLTWDVRYVLIDFNYESNSGASGIHDR